MKELTRKIESLLLFAGMSTILHADIQRLTRYESSVDKQSQYRALVTTSVALTAGSHTDTFSILIRQFGDQQIKAILLKDGTGRILDAQISYLPSGMRLSLQATGSWLLTYEVDSVSGQMSRIPLPVTSIPPPPGGKVVHINLRLASGQGTYGDLFPGMNWSSPHEGSTTMLSVPSFIIVHNKEASQISPGERLLTAANVANLGMLALVALGLSVSIVKLSRQRSNRSKVEA